MGPVSVFFGECKVPPRAVRSPSIPKGLNFDPALRVDTEIHAVNQTTITALVHMVTHGDFDPFSVGDVVVL